MAVVLGLLFSTLIAPGLLAYRLRRTRAWWVSGIVIALFGVYLMMTLDHEDHHGEGGSAGMYGLANLVQIAYGVLMLIHATLLLAITYASRRGRRKSPSIPTARVV